MVLAAAYPPGQISKSKHTINDLSQKIMNRKDTESKRNDASPMELELELFALLQPLTIVLMISPFSLQYLLGGVVNGASHKILTCKIVKFDVDG